MRRFYGFKMLFLVAFMKLNANLRLPPPEHYSGQVWSKK